MLRSRVTHVYPEISEQMSPHLPKKTDSFLSKFSFSQHLEDGNSAEHTHREETHREETHRAQLYSKNDVSITLTATIMMTVRIYIVMGEWFILISSLYTLLKTSVLKNGDCICDM